MVKLIAIPSMVVAILLVAMGCGSSGSASEASAPAKADFIKRADAICERIDKRQKVDFNAYFDKHPNATASKAVKEEVVLIGLPAVRVEAEELDALPTPEGDEDEIQRIIDGIEKAVRLAEANPDPLTRGGAGPFAEVDKVAREYGFKACALPL